MKKPVCQDDSEAYRLFGTPDEFQLEGIMDDAHELSAGLTAWRAISFALERGIDLPASLRQYLISAAHGIDDWAALNGHPSELKAVLALEGKRKFENEQRDPRYIYDAICQLRKQKPNASVKNLVRECMAQFPRVGFEEEYVRQKYYQGKKLADTGKDFKGRGRERPEPRRPHVALPNDAEEADF